MRNCILLKVGLPRDFRAAANLSMTDDVKCANLRFMAGEGLEIRSPAQVAEFLDAVLPHR